MHGEIIVYFPPEQMLADINVIFTNNQKIMLKGVIPKKSILITPKNVEAGSTFLYY